jgi:hypothetical protein
MRALTRGRVVERQAAGFLRADLDAEVAADLILGSYESFARRMAELTAKPDLAAWADSFLKAVYQGILAPARPRRTPR